MTSYRVICDHHDVFNRYLIVFITFKLIVFKNIRQFFNYAVFGSFLSNCYRELSCRGSISFLVKYKLICLVSVLSDAILTLLISVFLKKKGHKFWMQLIFVFNV